MHEEATKTMQELLKEAVKKYMNESINEKDEHEDDDALTNDEKEEGSEDIDITTVTDDSIADDDEKAGDEESADDETIIATDELESPDETGDDEWAEFDKYKNDAGEYDFSTMEDGEDAVKVYKLLDDEDEVVVVKNGDTINIKDNETGAEYVVELGDEEEAEESVEDKVEDSFEHGSEDEDETLYEVDLSKLGEIIAESIGNMASCEVGKKMKDEEKDLSEEVVEDDENQLDENGTKTKQNSTKMTLKPNKGQRLPSGAPKRGPGLQAEDILRKVNALEEENSTLKDALVKFKGALQEAALLNVNLGQIVRLISENTTSKEEKIDIIERFDKEAKTIKESNQLYESIKRSLSKKVTPSIVTEKQFTQTTNVSENKVYQSKDTANIISLMDRLNNLGK